jgi:co-chaperonin GroES (HSP10)
MRSPLNNFVLVRQFTEGGVLQSGIELPSEDICVGEVLGVGEKINWVNVGDIVFFSKYAIAKERKTDEGVYIHKTGLGLVINK